MADAGKNYFNKIIMGEETWCFACEPETEIPKVPHQDLKA
jgi:hypothetical protein